jgi:hypothetical protein
MDRPRPQDDFGVRSPLALGPAPSVSTHLCLALHRDRGCNCASRFFRPVRQGDGWHHGRTEGEGRAVRRRAARKVEETVRPASVFASIQAARRARSSSVSAPGCGQGGFPVGVSVHPRRVTRRSRGRSRSGRSASRPLRLASHITESGRRCARRPRCGARHRASGSMRSR